MPKNNYSQATHNEKNNDEIQHDKNSLLVQNFHHIRATRK